VLNEVKCSAT